MGLTNELAWSNSLISTFLRERFPHRDALVARRLHQLPGYTKVAVPDRAVLILGVAFELRIGLDLAHSPPVPDILARLDPATTQHMPRLAGFSPGADPSDIAGWTRDPTWIHTRTAVESDELLRWSWFLAHLEPMWHVNPDVISPVSVAALIERAPALFEPADAFVSLQLLWERYENGGRDQLTALGPTTAIAPILAPGFAIADLVLGSTLIDIKTHAAPAEHLEGFISQVAAVRSSRSRLPSASRAS